MIDQFLQSLIAMSDANQQSMDGTTKPVQKIIDENDVVFGVWNDPESRCGVGFHIIKGGHLLNEIIGAGKSQQHKTSAVYVDNFEMAEAARLTLGDGKLLN
jgi:hypothetical protein